MPLRLATKEEKEFFKYAMNVRRKARESIKLILDSEKKYLRSVSVNSRKRLEPYMARERTLAYMRAAEDKLDKESIKKFGLPAFVVIGI